MVDTAALAAQVAAGLTPFLPYLLKAGEKAAEEAGKKFGAAAWDSTKALWARLHPKIEAKPAAQEAVEDAAADPKNEDAQTVLRLQLKKILAEDDALAQDVARLWSQAQQAGVSVNVTGDQNVTVGGNMTGSTVVTGDRNKVQQGKYNLDIGQASGFAIGDNASVTSGSAQSSADLATIQRDPLANTLFETLCDQYNLEELHTLCFVLGVDFDALLGEGKTAKARELVALMQRQRQLDRLQAALRQPRA